VIVQNIFGGVIALYAKGYISPNLENNLNNLNTVVNPTASEN
jgi:hypothetical protein